MKKVLIVFYSLIIFVFLYIPVLAQEDSDSTESAEVEEVSEVDEAVQQKVEEVLNKPKARLGTITDITELTIQMKTLEGEIQQVSFTTEKTTFVKVNEKSETIDYSEVAIGDFIIAMGYFNGNNVLEAERILVTTEITPPKRLVAFGEIESIEGKKIKIINTNEELELIFPARWSGPEISELEKDLKVVVVAQVSDDELPSIRTIQIITEQEVTPTSEE